MRYQYLNLLRNLAVSFLESTLLLGVGISAAYNNYFRLEASGKSSSAVAWRDRRLTSQVNVGSVPFCVLVTKPTLYDQRIVRTTAILIAGDEQWFLYSPHCDGLDKFVWAENDPALKSSPTIDKRLESILKIKSSKHSAGRAEIAVLGRFIAPGGKRFGHLDQFRMKFVIIRIEHVTSVSHDTTWPLSDGVSGDASETEQTIRYINKEFVFHLAGAPSYSVVPSEILADDFTFTDVNEHRKGKPEFLEARVPVFLGKIYDTEIEVYACGDTAVATGLLVKSRDNSPEKRYQYTNKYVRRYGTWQIISSRLKEL